MKRLFALILALTMVFAMAATAFAEQTSDGTISISNASENTVYKIYRMMDLESFKKDDTTQAYSYKISQKWEAFFEGPGATYVTLNENGYVTWVGATDDSAKADFAKIALQYAEEHHIAPDEISDIQGGNDNPNYKIVEENGKTYGRFSNLPLGWYLVDSNAGALCGLTTTDKNAVVNAKNQVPGIDKTVKEDSTGVYGDSNTADIGQKVEFMSIITVVPGAQNYVLHDKMSEGLTFDKNSVVVKVIPSGGTETEVDASEYKVKADQTDADDDNPCAECTFDVVFTPEYIKRLHPNDKLVVYYSAMLNRNAVIAGTGNSNKSWVEFGEGNHVTNPDETHTFTFSVDIVKTDATNKLLDGAKFLIYDAATGGKVVAVVPLMEADNTTPVRDENGNPMYRRARDDEQKAQDDAYEDSKDLNSYTQIEVVGGQVTVVGFDNGIYYLEETVAPVGYNKLTARQEFTVADKNLEAEFLGDIYSTGTGIHVENNTGVMMPETGAMGTLMFITFGTFVALGTGVLLITKKRVSLIED